MQDYTVGSGFPVCAPGERAICQCGCAVVFVTCTYCGWAICEEHAIPRDHWDGIRLETMTRIWVGPCCEGIGSW